MRETQCRLWTRNSLRYNVSHRRNRTKFRLLFFDILKIKGNKPAVKVLKYKDLEIPLKNPIILILIIMTMNTEQYSIILEITALSNELYFYNLTLKKK